MYLNSINYLLQMLAKVSNQINKYYKRYKMSFIIIFTNGSK